MKKFLSLIALAVSLGMTSCSDDVCTHEKPVPPPEEFTYFPLADGETSSMWYEEVYNEEITYYGSGTFYDRYSNMERSGELEGRWEYDSKNKKLTYRYSFIGNNVQDDLTIKSESNYEVIISSISAAALKLEKIVEKHTLDVGGTTTLDFSNDHNVTSYTSTNDRIAGVSRDGIVSATGEKGTAYIKMSGSFGTVWSKVTVGDDRKDLWCDMEPIIGMSYEQMTQRFSQFGKPQQVGGYKDFFGYVLNIHDYIESICMVVDFVNDKVVQIQLKVKDGVPSSEITAYLKSRYYSQPQYTNYYTSLSNEADSNIIITFDTKLNQIVFYDRAYNTAPVRDFVPMFGKTKDNVQEIMENSGFQFLFSDYSYSQNGSDYFDSSGFGVDENISMVGFVYNASDAVAEVWAYKKPYVSYTTFKNYFRKLYNYNSDESTNIKSVYYNDEKTIRITVDTSYEAIIFTDLTTSIVAP